MRRPSSYSTKQGEAILSYIASLEGNHVTVEQIVKHFENQAMSIGLTTIYRNLDKLLASGKIRKYMIDGISGACFQYIMEPSTGGNHFHFKCESCGKLHHLQCRMLDEVDHHIAFQHSFQINPAKTVFYGTCKNCFNQA